MATTLDTATLETTRTHSPLGTALRKNGGTIDRPLFPVEQAELARLCSITNDVIYREQQLGISWSGVSVYLSARVLRSIDNNFADPGLGELATEVAIDELIDECFVSPDSRDGRYQVVHVVTQTGVPAIVVDLA